ncbi:unnamed protein product, partial [Owenia fusiformis]
QYYGMDHDAFEHAVEHECLELSNHQLPDNGKYNSQRTYNPYNRNMGQMTVYRLRIKCDCAGDPRLQQQGARCSKVLPYNQQEWPAYMGKYANSHWMDRNHQNS